MGIGKELKRIRENSRLTAGQLAALTGVDVDRLRKWEQKDLNPKLEDARKLEKFFKVGLDKLNTIDKVPESSISDELLHLPKMGTAHL
jgi:transcriptional regulator with XRE-family HTH domain